MNTAHIVKIRRKGEVIGVQLRVGAGGPGQTSYFAANDGEFKAVNAAKRQARAQGLTIAIGRGGSDKGRRTSRSPTSAAGIRWYWTPHHGSATLKVVASWVDKTGKACSTSYSVAHNGLAGALELAIEKRVSNGYPVPDAAKLQRELTRAYRSGPAA